MVVCLAGDAAECLIAPAALTWIPGPTDKNRARQTLALASPFDIGARLAIAESYAERLVKKHWSQIETVAEALMCAGTLSGDQVRALL